MYDPEAIYQDDDFEQAELERVGRGMDAALRSGRVKCFHGGVKPVGDHNAPDWDGRMQCWKCGEIFENDDAWWQEHQRLIQRNT